MNGLYPTYRNSTIMNTKNSPQYSGERFVCFTAMNTRIGFLFDALLWVAYLSAEQNQINDL